MLNSIPTKRAGATALLAALSLLLTGCFVTPGKFVSGLNLKKDNSFAFTYQGEIYFLGLGQLAMMDDGEGEFSPSCYDFDNDDNRDCTQAEVAEQRANFSKAQHGRCFCFRENGNTKRNAEKHVQE